MIMDIGAKKGYPSSSLSNFAAHKFVFDGVECNSMEGFLQSLKSSNHDVQIERCKLTGYKAKQSGSKINWQEKQILYWKGKEYKRASKAYQTLLDLAYQALGTNRDFQNALLATGNATLTHSIGRTNQNETVLTRQEFCSRLTKMRYTLQNEDIFRG